MNKKLIKSKLIMKKNKETEQYSDAKIRIFTKTKPLENSQKRVAQKL